MSTVDWLAKGLWNPGGDGDLIGADIFDGPFTWPLMVVHGPSVAANVAGMARYCARHDVDFAPHGKTTMAPTLFRRQLDAGAWAITVATAHQALVARRFGVPRVLLANEVLDPRVLRWAADECAAGWDFLCYVDSTAGVEALRSAVPAGGRVRVLVELGYPGGRAGCRTVDEAERVAREAAAVPGVELAGVAGFEGLLPNVDAVAAFLATIAAAGARLAPLMAQPPILTAGGSSFFDVVVAVLGPAARALGGRLVLRSGGVVTHDNGVYERTTPFTRVPEEGSLAAALRVWAQVLSAPEPGLAILGAGKRDLPYDMGLPVPLGTRGRDGTPGRLPGSSVEALNDQHAYLRGADLTPGDLVELGVSHPCTAFDKWRAIPVVDDTHHVTDLLHTHF
jgi:D-serine deaminase-like pyridoxal phosphate-dependent protein